jgi:glycosyltransferase involved in cell wall biosynthesis
VGDAIRSVARQTLRGLECVIVDDASTDDSLAVIRAVLEELRDTRFAVLRLDANLGQTGASRAGLGRTNAPFVCFLDADDVWNENFLERHLAAHMNETCAAGFTACNAACHRRRRRPDRRHGLLVRPGPRRERARSGIRGARRGARAGRRSRQGCGLARPDFVSAVHQTLPSMGSGSAPPR